MCKCLNGSSCDTVIGTCYYPPGFTRADCSQICPVDHYGQDRVQQCSCGSGQCDPVTGGCQCPPGQMGARYQQDFSTKSSRSHLQFPKYTKHVVLRTIKDVLQTMYGPNCELNVPEKWWPLQSYGQKFYLWS